MPNRDLKESNRRSPSLQVLSDAAERLWYRIITAVDDFGRMEADPEVVFTSCFQRAPKGWTIEKVGKCLNELAALHAAGQSPLIHIYHVEDRYYLQINSASQHIYRRAKDSKYPHPLTPREERSAHICAQVHADSLDSRVPNPESPSLESRIPEPRTSVGEPTTAQAIGRLESFTLTPELEAWSAKEGIHEPSQYVEEFKDYWRSTGGKRKNGQSVKDWDAAFRNRLRTLKDAGKLKPKDPFAQLLAQEST